MPRPAAARHAFTLLEVLIALALSVLLIFSVYSSITMYYRFNIAGRGEIAGQQFLRGLNRVLGEDIGSVVFVLPEESSTSTSGQAADESAGSSSSSGFSSGESSAFDSTGQAATATLSFSGLGEGGLPPMFGLIGTAQMLHLCTNLPTREQAYTAVLDRQTGGERISHLQVISYGLLTLDTLTLATMEKDLGVNRPDQGLGRRARDLYAADSVDETLSMENLLAAEVTELEFLYFDGVDWFDSWDSLTIGMLPRAIEVHYGIWSPPPRQLGRRVTRTEGTVTRYSHLFFLPLSEPVTGGTP